MIEMKLKADSTDPHKNILEVTVSAPPATTVISIPHDLVPTLFVIDDSITSDQLPIITHALTDTINRITWPNQIRILSSKHKFAQHLEIELIQSATDLKTLEFREPFNLILLTNFEGRNANQLISNSSRLVAKSNYIRPTTTIDLIDNINDHVNNLKEKTIVNLNLEISLPSEQETLEPLNYIPDLTKEGNTYFANLIDLASEEKKAYAFKTEASAVSANYRYDDLILIRTVTGGQSLTL